ncbi:MAG TPA: GNAT family N-acetyltransferase [Tepidisphaeraceae bacterium]|nr:GNAT family N-acetyltransferase [Tepidisphaeraceae bacterium]
MPFDFREPGPLIDGELELVPPNAIYVEDVLAACKHPLTVRDAPKEAQGTTREALERFLRAAPAGREQGDPARGRVPSYHFWMKLHPAGEKRAPIPIAGGIGLRVGTNEEIRKYAGHLGYHVYPPARGHHYAERACRMLLPLARAHGIRELWITVNPENFASRRTCERLGATLIDMIPIPADHPFYARGERAKCRYMLEL